jgi:hypothetical protein
MVYKVSEWHIKWDIVVAYKEFEERASHVSPARGAKTGLVEDAIERQLGEFSISDIERECPNVSRVMIKKVLSQMRVARKIKCLGKGKSAHWVRT